jgi:uncharacterized radical SAM superfamily Fe-S cluster-containing enzyme
MKSKSVCPVCFKVLAAEKIERNNNIYLEKECPDHGKFSVLIWEGDFESYNKWDSGDAGRDRVPGARPAKNGCPFDCGICENHKRATCCVLLELTQYCDLACPVCFASAKLTPTDFRPNDLSLNQIRDIYKKLLAEGGPYNIQLSGGEPTLRDDLPKIIEIGKQEGFSFFQLNTNGLRIAKDINYLQSLKNAGLSAVFLQFDGVSESAYKILRGAPLLNQKLQALENCQKLELGAVLVPTVVKGVNDNQIGEIISFAVKRSPYVRGVHFQPASFFGRYAVNFKERTTIPSFLQNIETQTSGAMKASDFAAGGAENSYCSFHAAYSVGASLKLLKPASSCCSSENSRDSTARRWELKEIGCCAAEKSFDDFLLEFERNVLTVSGMFFQDAFNMDLERLQSCYICEITPEGDRVPFCAYNAFYRNKLGNKCENKCEYQK